ncbi:MAG: 2-succinyl-5-enolpyruvyl-6-hydroxy-3-cyclohexene-1-carboxylic-acid synthase [Myxococcota bacterium]|nr:2-succinyl-5-enolpyruvyl-6-hydroxy-3-cyclohexene-1-carboxylic-acid synthase [Myxococcota bacterium]
MGAGAPRDGFTASPAEVRAFAGAFFQELARSGVRDVCISPGSRSTPLAVAAHLEPGLRCRPILDERSAAFFALGLARQSGAPVALVCTSGTAAANYLPAVVEAHLARIPLLLLTADRPPELRDWGAGQTIDQLGLYGSYVRRFVELPVPTGGERALRYARSLACRAVADARGVPAGPVHLNWPLREPLEPGDLLAEPGPAAGEPARGRPSAPWSTVVAPQPAPGRDEIEALLEISRTFERGLLVCGPLDPDPRCSSAIVELARLTGWPILADPLSQLRRGPHAAGAPLLCHGDLLLRDPAIAARWAPDVVVRIGDSPVSKALRLALEARPPRHLVLVDPDRVWHDPSHLASRVVVVDPASLCEAWALGWKEAGWAPRESDYLRDCVAADRRAAEALHAALADRPDLGEAAAVRELVDALGPEASLYVSNSMPIRLLDAFLPAAQGPVALLGHRGASGIDGLVSAAAGAAAADRGPVVLLTGDLALLHDVGGLRLAADLPRGLTIVVLDNDGGGIFSFLPVAEHGEAVDFERLFRTPHGLDLAHLAPLHSASFVRARGVSDYRRSLEGRLEDPGLRLVHVPLDRDSQVKHFRELAALAVAAAQGA